MNDRNQPTSPKPSKLLPHWQQVPKWMENLEIQYSMGSSLIPHIVSGIKCTYPVMNKQRNSHYDEDPYNAPKRYVMRIKHPKDPNNIFWTRDNGDIQYDNHAKHGSKIYPKTHECCSDQTSNSLISVLRCHPWISNADTTQYSEDL